MKHKMNTLFVIVIALAMGLSACSSSTPVAPVVEPTTAPAVEPAPAESGNMLPEVDPAAYSGNIVAAGSSTVFPLAEVMADRFADEGFAGQVTIDSIGSGAGFERFCKTGETDIANASRAIKASEIENCAAIGRTPIEFLVGIDALAIVVSSENDFLTDVTLEELGKIYSSSAVKWSDVRPEWPNENIQRFSPGTDSGTFDFFVEVAMGPLHKNAEGKADLDAAEKDILDAANIQELGDELFSLVEKDGHKKVLLDFGGVVHFAHFGGQRWLGHGFLLLAVLSLSQVNVNYFHYVE